MLRKQRLTEPFPFRRSASGAEPQQRTEERILPMDDDRYYDDYYEDRRQRGRRRRRGNGFFRLVILLLILAVCIYKKEALITGFGTLSESVKGLLSGDNEIIPEEMLSLDDLKEKVTGGQTEGDPGVGETDNAAAGRDEEDRAAEQSTVDEETSPAEEIFSSDVYYYYRNMQEEDRKIYRQLYAGVMDMEQDITFSSLTDYDRLYRIESLVIADHPEIFWYEGAGTYTQYTTKLVLHPDYTISTEERKNREEKIAAAVQEFKSRIGADETAYEKVATAFNFIAGKCKYVEGAPDDQNICSSLIYHESVCAGYARGVQYLLQQLGIECLYVWGTITEHGDHAWNIVNIDGKYYHSDPTFGDRSFSDGTEVENMPEALAMEYGYLCMNDEEALRDRVVSAELGGWASLPVCSSTEMSYYHRHGWYYPEYAEAVWDELSHELGEGQRFFRVQFGTEEAMQQFLDELSENRYAKMDLEKLSLSEVRTYTSPNSTLRVVVGWIA